MFILSSQLAANQRQDALSIADKLGPRVSSLGRNEDFLSRKERLDK